MAEQVPAPPVITITAPLLPGGLDVLQDARPERAPRVARGPGRRRPGSDVLVVGGVTVLVLLALGSLAELSVLLAGEPLTGFLTLTGSGVAGAVRTVLREVVLATGTPLRVRASGPGGGGQTELVVPLLLTVAGPALHAQLLRQRARGRTPRQQLVLAAGSTLLVTAAVVASSLTSRQTVHADGLSIRTDSSFLRAGLSTALVLTLTSSLVLLGRSGPLLRAARRGAAATTVTGLVAGWVAVQVTTLAVPSGPGVAETARALPGSLAVLPSYGVYAWAVSAFGRLTLVTHGRGIDANEGAFGLHDRQGLSGALYVAAVLLPLLSALVGLVVVARTPGVDRGRRALALPLSALLSGLAFLLLAELSVVRLGGAQQLRAGPEPVAATLLVLAVLLPLGLLLGLALLLAPASLRVSVRLRRPHPWRALASRLPEGVAWPVTLSVVAVLLLGGTGITAAVHDGRGAFSETITDTGDSVDGSGDAGTATTSPDGSGSDGSGSDDESDDETVRGVLLQVAAAEQQQHDAAGSYDDDVTDLDVTVPDDVFVSVDDRGSSFCASAEADSSDTTFSYDSAVGTVEDSDVC